jgi:hypothetical protein
MDKVEFHPIGSIVQVRGGVKKLMIVARGLAAEVQGETREFDYGGCLYPEGLIADQVLYFNHADIAKVVHLGFADGDEAMMVENLNEWLLKSPYERGNPEDLNRQKKATAAS